LKKKNIFKNILISNNLNSNYFIITVFFFIIELIINPIGNFPLNDDWAYAKSVEVMYLKNDFQLGFWPAMSLFAHVVWGFLFVKLFGFSFTVLRFSVLCLAFISLIYTHKLAYKITLNKNTALIITLLLLVNPFFVNLSNTYMTDVSFLCNLILSIYFFYLYFNTKFLKYMVIGFVFYLIALFIRQLAICLPLSFMLICFINFLFNKKNLKPFIISICLFCSSMYLFYMYEQLMCKSLYDSCAYQGLFFFKAKTLFSFIPYIQNFYTRFAILLLYLGLMVFPLIIFKLNYILQNIFSISFVGKLSVILLTYCICLVYQSYPIGNVLYNIGLGIEGINLKLKLDHKTANFMFLDTIRIASLIGSILFCIYFFIGIKISIKIKEFTPKNQFSLFILGLLVIYMLLFAMFVAFFDRYSLLFSLLGILLLINKSNFNISKPHMVYVLIFVLGLFSSLATKDNFNYNRINNALISNLLDNKKINKNEVNGGFEWMMWNYYYDSFCWSRYFFGEHFKYQTSFSTKIPHYKIIKKVGYQRYIPFKTDTIYLLQLTE
jgi:hypothetical protein